MKDNKLRKTCRRRSLECSKKCFKPDQCISLDKEAENEPGYQSKEMKSGDKLIAERKEN